MMHSCNLSKHAFTPSYFIVCYFYLRLTQNRLLNNGRFPILQHFHRRLSVLFSFASIPIVYHYTSQLRKRLMLLFHNSKKMTLQRSSSDIKRAKTDTPICIIDSSLNKWRKYIKREVKIEGIMQNLDMGRWDCEKWSFLLNWASVKWREIAAEWYLQISYEQHQRV